MDEDELKSDEYFGKSSRGIKSFWLVDFLVIIIFLFTAAVCVFLFRQDLMQSIGARDEEPVGMIIIRQNVIQRRFADRVLWERLVVDSPVYSGDLIRAADLSEATILLNDNHLGINENTLVRIQQSHDGSGSFEIDLREGNLNVTTGSSAGAAIVLNIMGSQVEAAPGTVLNAGLGEEGMIVQVSEGEAVFIEEGETRVLDEGAMVMKDSKGVEVKTAAAVVTRPQPNARYLKNNAELLPVRFSWKRMNFDAGEKLRMEIASDKNFGRDLRSINDLDSYAQVDFDSGVWYWRLCFGDAVLSKGELTVADASGPELISPAFSAIFRYQNDFPQLRFQWSQRPGASHYILEISETEEFSSPKISRQVSSASFIFSELEQGTWYWRVLPVFSSVFEGSANYSDASSFQIEKTSDSKAPALEIPVIAPKREPPKPPRPPVMPPPSASGRPAAGSPAAVAGQTPGSVVTYQGVRYYTVQRGDCLTRIAFKEYGRESLWRKIFEANDIQDPDLIYINQVLIIPF